MKGRGLVHNLFEQMFEEFDALIDWRRPKGTPMATPCYMRILNRYFKLRACPRCKTVGHVGFERCPICHGSGRNPVFPAGVTRRST